MIVICNGLAPSTDFNSDKDLEEYGRNLAQHYPDEELIYMNEFFESPSLPEDDSSGRITFIGHSSVHTFADITADEFSKKLKISLEKINGSLSKNQKKITSIDFDTCEAGFFSKDPKGGGVVPPFAFDIAKELKSANISVKTFTNLAITDDQITEHKIMLHILNEDKGMVKNFNFDNIKEKYELFQTITSTFENSQIIRIAFLTKDQSDQDLKIKKHSSKIQENFKNNMEEFYEIVKNLKPEHRSMIEENLLLRINIKKEDEEKRDLELKLNVLNSKERYLKNIKNEKTYKIDSSEKERIDQILIKLNDCEKNISANKQKLDKSISKINAINPDQDYKEKFEACKSKITALSTDWGSIRFLRYRSQQNGLVYGTIPVQDMRNIFDTSIYCNVTALVPKETKRAIISASGVSQVGLFAPKSKQQTAAEHGTNAKQGLGTYHNNK